jgi:hypothetical protein
MDLELNHYIEIFSLLVSILCSGKLKNSFLITFMPYLLLTLLVELAASFVYQNYGKPTGWMYNILNLVSHIFYAFIFCRFSTVNKHRKIYLVLVSIYVICSLIYYSSVSWYVFSNYVIAAGGILEVIFCCLHFYEYLQNDEYVHERHYTSGLWIASGILMFYSGITICFSLYNYILLKDLRLFNLPLYNIIPQSLSIILYCCISIALVIWKKPLQTSS